MILDEMDLKILSLLEQNARRSIKEISEIVHMSQPAVKDRILKMQDGNIIIGYTIITKYELKAFFQLSTTKCLEFEKFCDNNTLISKYYRITGEYNYLFEVVSKTMDAIQNIQEEILFFGPSKMYLVNKDSTTHRK